jgi:ParB/RepB/Spo0J family partition protein
MSSLGSIGDITKGKLKTTGVSAFSELELSKVFPNPEQPRKKFDDIEELAATIKEHGLLQPITVVRKDDGYMIVGGERRYKAHLFNEAKTIKAHIIQVDNHQLQEMALIENIQRNDLTDFEKAKYIGVLWASGKYERKLDLAAKIGKSSSYISKAFGCLSLDETILEDLENNISTVPLSVLEEISRVKDKETQIDVYSKYVTGEITRDEIKSFKPKKKEKRYDDAVFEVDENFPWENVNKIVLIGKAGEDCRCINVEDSSTFYFYNYGLGSNKVFKKNKQYKITIEEI